MLEVSIKSKIGCVYFQRSR